jgi:hypothetical protein
MKIDTEGVFGFVGEAVLEMVGPFHGRARL